MSRRLGLIASRSGIALLNVTALGALAVAAACSSSSGNVVPPSGDDSGTSSGTSGSTSGGSTSGGSTSGGSTSGGSTSGGSTSGGSSSSSTSSSGSGEGGSCPMVSDAWIGVKLSFNVVWGQGGASGTGAASDPGGPAAVNIWLLSEEKGGTSFTGTAKACGTTLPDLELNAAGDFALSVAVGASGLVNPAIPNSAFDAITRTYSNTGTQGFNIGDTISTTATLGLLGLSDTSSYHMASTAWPPYCASNANCLITCASAGGACTGGNSSWLNGSDVTDDDKDGNPGITAVPLTSAAGGATCPTYSTNNGSPPTAPCTYFDPPTQVAIGNGPAADKVYIVSRQQFSLSGIRSDCQQGMGTASVTLFDNHVVGCHLKSGSACATADVQFLDQNRPVYADANNKAFGPTSSNNGTVKVYQFPQGMTPTCNDVRTNTFLK